jgi:general secretion pathway protein G
MVGLFTVLVGVRERRQAGERRTRAVLTEYRQALDAHLAAHEDKCPKSLSAVRESSGLEEPPVDAWGRALRFSCPSNVEGEPYLLSSDGADGLPGGLDRIE